MAKTMENIAREKPPLTLRKFIKHNLPRLIDQLIKDLEKQTRT